MLHFNRARFLQIDPAVTVPVSPLTYLFTGYIKLLSSVYSQPWSERLHGSEYETAPPKLGFTLPGEQAAGACGSAATAYMLIDRHLKHQFSIIPTEAQRNSLRQVSLADLHVAAILANQLANMRGNAEELDTQDVVTFSGGLDSVITANLVADMSRGEHTALMHFNYAGPYSDKETRIARELMQNMSSTAIQGVIHYLATYFKVSIDSDKLIDGYIIPGRNGFLALAAFFSYSDTVRNIWMTAHYRSDAGQDVGAIDKNLRFFSELSNILTACVQKTMQVGTLTIGMSKADSILWAMEMVAGSSLEAELREQMAMTTSCYHPEHFRCGECSACYKRYQAMREVGIDEGEDYAVHPELSQQKHAEREARKGR